MSIFKQQPCLQAKAKDCELKKFMDSCINVAWPSCSIIQHKIHAICKECKRNGR